MDNTDKFKNKYRIASARASWWDYGWPGTYFITICTAERRPYFGEIIDGKMVLSNIGVLADVLWHDLPCHAHQVDLGAFVIMPNHMHGILILKENGNNTPPNYGETRFQNQGKNTVSAMVGGYKSALSKHAHRLGFTFAWQARFHDHIIRNDLEYQRINDYIETNPQHWHEDRFYKQENNSMHLES